LRYISRQKEFVVNALKLPAILLIVVALQAAWIFRQIVPSGLPIGRLSEYYILDPIDYGILHSPQRTNQVRVIGKSNGPRSSGYRWVWVEKASLITGRSIVAEGFVSCPSGHKYDLPIRWLSETSLKVSFRRGTYSDAEDVKLYCVDDGRLKLIAASVFVVGVLCAAVFWWRAVRRGRKPRMLTVLYP
jgi:hypothetical protein